MQSIYTWINYGCCGFTAVMTLAMLISFRKARPIGPLRLLLSAALSLVILPAYLLIAGVRLNLWIGSALFLLGVFLGALRGLAVRLYHQEDRIVGKYSLLSLLLWGFSLGLAILLGQARSPVIAALGLIPLFFTTGVQVSMNLVIFLRRLWIRPPRPAPI